MTPDQHRFLRFVPDQIAHRHDASGDYVTVTAPGGHQAFRLSPVEYDLAQLFDGERDEAARNAAASEYLDETLSPPEIANFTRDLAEAGLLASGSDEPLPPPAQIADRADDRPNDTSERGSGFPPSSLPGSLATPSNQGPVVGTSSGPRGAADGPRVRLPLGPLTGLGHALNATLYTAWLFWLPLLLLVAALFGLWINRLDAAGDALRLLAPFRLVLIGLPTALLVNLLSQVARAAAVRHYTHEPPTFGLDFAFGFLPRFATATEGPAERADNRGRVAIVSAAPHAILWLAVLAALGWFLSRNSGTFLPTLCLGATVFSIIGLLMRLNPLVRRDGYFLLAHWLGIPDLREQAWLSLFGFQRPWADRPPPPKTPMRLYALAIIAYVVAVITLITLYPGRWLEHLWGGTGVVVFLVVMGAIAFEQSRRMRAGRGRIEGWKFRPRAPSRLGWLLITLFALLAMFPYTYSPSGPLEVLPRDQADVSAPVEGEVKQIKVEEGERVAADDVLVQLANAQQRAQVAAAEAKLRKLQADFALVKKGSSKEEIELARQRVKTARKRLKYSSEEADRLESAYQRNAVSISAYQKAAGSAAVQREQLAEAKRQLELVTAGARDKRLESLKAEIEAQKAELEFHRTQLANTRLKAPIDGRVASDSLLFARGDYLETGELIATISDTSRLFAEARMPESTVDEFTTGDSAVAKVWAHPGTGFPGEVVEIAPTAEEGDYGRIVRVLIALDDTGGRLKPGLTGHAKIEAGVYPAIIVFTRALARFVLIEIWSWLP